MKFFVLVATVAALSAFDAAAQDSWVVGQSAPLTLSNTAFGRDVRNGALAYFKSVNAKGGVNGKSIELITLDDSNDRKKAAANTKELIDSRKASVLFGYASATLSLDAIPQAEKDGVAFFAPFSGAGPVRKASPVVFTIRASYSQEMERLLGFWTGVGMNEVVVLHYDDEVGRANLATVTEYLAKSGKKPKSFTILRNQEFSENQADELLKLHPDVIISTVLSQPAAQLSKVIAGRKMALPVSSLSFVGAEQFMALAGTSAAGVSIVQVVPGTNTTLPIVKECAKALSDANIPEPLSSASLESCIGAKVLVEAMRKTKKVNDRKEILTTLQNLGTLDLGGFTLTFKPGDQHGSKYTSLAMVTRDGRLKN